MHTLSKNQTKMAALLISVFPLESSPFKLSSIAIQNALWALVTFEKSSFMPNIGEQ